MNGQESVEISERLLERMRATTIAKRDLMDSERNFSNCGEVLYAA